MQSQPANTQEQEFRIDVERVFRKKNPGVAKLIPKFIFSWIKRIIHQSDINMAMTKGAHLRDAAFAEFSIQFIGATFYSSGKEHIPETGGAIVASNHPLGGLDGMALLVEATRVRSDSRFIVNDILMSLPHFEHQFVPVNKIGANARESLKRIEDTYSSGNLVLIFPAGICSRKQNGRVLDMEWNKSFIGRAIKYDLPVIPTFISGTNTRRFYNVSRIRKFFGIKANIEMFFLPDEMFKQKGKELHIIFGKPMPASFFDKRHSQTEWANLMRNFVYTLEKEPYGSFEDFVNAADSTP